MTCSVSGCQNPTHLRSWCSAHYQRWRSHGDPEGGGPSKTRNSGPCSVDGCSKSARTRGWCSSHYKQWWKSGGTREPRVRPERQESYLIRGYRRIRLPDGGFAMEHRHVMQTYLGRPLSKQETVHHRNGDRLDNRIENLELWSSSHPSGQRVTDKVEWAKELLALYEPESLAKEV